MDASLETEQDNIDGGHKSEQQGDLEHQFGISEDTDKTARPSLSEFKKSWGFRRTTVAKREFMDEVIDLDPSPQLVRRGRSRRTRQTRQPAVEPEPPPKPSHSASSVIDNLEWSAPSSPSDTGATEASAGGTLDPSLWQDFGSAFHTAFSLLGGNEDTPVDAADPLPGPDDPYPPDFSETLAGAELPETGADGSDSVEGAEDLDPPGPAPMGVAADENQEVVMISSQDEESDNLTLMQLKEQLKSKGRTGRGGRGKARGKGRGRGRGRGRGKGRGRGRGRAVELESSTADDDEDQTLVNQEARPQLHKQQKPGSSPEEVVVLDSSLSPTKLMDSDCIVLDSDQSADGTPGQYDDSVEDGRVEEERGYKSISDSKGYDPNALYCICRQKHNKRFMICCDGCQEWLHGDCVGIGEALGRSMARREEAYTCPTCTSKKQRLTLPDVQSEDLLESPAIPASLSNVLAPAASAETVVEVTKQKESKEAAEVNAEQAKPQPDIKTETDSSFPLCIGPSCPKQALQDSVYCGTDCILQHAAVTMKSLTGPKEPKPRSRPQRKAAAKGQRSGGVTQSTAERLKENEVEQEGDGVQKEAASPHASNSSLSAVEAAPVPSSVLCMASNKGLEHLEAKVESVPSVPQEPTTATSSSIPVADTPLPQGSTQGKTKKPLTTGGASKKQRLDSPQHTPANLHKPNAAPAPATPGPSSSRLPVTPALKLAKGSFVIPKKQPAAQPPPSQAPCPVAGTPPSSSPAAANETRTLPVAPAPIAPSSRPSQTNNQVRQSIQRSLTSILFKRVSSCGELDMSEADVGKLVTAIEMEMFDIFRNTDSKYMNKYRTIMFNLKDPKNKGLLFRVIRGEISPFRLARMSQKDMQATKVPEPSAKETTEVKDMDGKAPQCSLQKPDAVKVDLPSLSTPKSEKPMEQKRSIPPAAKSRPVQPSQISSVPDMLSCMLKDTTSEHKTHLFDLKCRICTGQIQEEEDEPAQKRSKVSDSRDKRDYGRTSYSKPPENPWRSCAGDDSPLRAPPDSPDMESPPNPLQDSSSRLVIDSPELSTVESPASPVMKPPASPVLESPASPVMDSPASPTADGFKAKPPSRAYAPVVIPAVSTVTITRRDPRTAANRSSALSTGPPGPSRTAQNQTAPYAALRAASSGPTMPSAMPLPPPPMPRSILTKPSPSADPRLYQTSARNMHSHSAADGETTQFLANQTILWKGFLNMLSVAKFMTKGYVVSGSGDLLKPELPDTIQIGGRILPQTVWDYVERLKTSVTKELCVVRFHPATEEEEVAYVSLFSYFSSRRRFGVVANSTSNIKDMYLVPISAKEAIPSILQPLEGPGLEKNRPNLLLGLAIVQKPKRPGCLQQESEEKRPKVQMARDPMWIPKPPVLYGSDKLDIFQPYDPETPIPSSPPSSPAASGTLTNPSLTIPSNSTVPQFLPSNRRTLPVLTSAPASSNQSIITANSDNNPSAASAHKTPLQTILSLFGNKTSDAVGPAESSSVAPTVSATMPLYKSQRTRPMVDPIVQQYGQKSKIKEIEEEEDNDFDRPYDPEEEYDPAMGYGAAHTAMKVHTDPPVPSSFAEDDVAYDPEDETMFEDVKKHDTVGKGHVPTSVPCPVPASTQAPAPAPTTEAATTTPVLQNLPTDKVFVSAATLTEQQRMLEELNKQIEEQKRQLKEQEEALRQQREAVGMFMAHFSVSDTLMSPPQKGVLPAALLPSQQSGTAQSGQKTPESIDKVSLQKAMNNQTLEIVKKEETITSSAIIEQDVTVKDTEQYFSAGEIEDSDVAYDPEDESLFNEMQDDIFQGDSTKPQDSSLSRSGPGSPRKGSPSSSHRGRRPRQSPKRRSRRERDHRGSPSRSAQQRSPSHSRRRKDRERHRRSERDRPKHSTRDQSERQGRHRRERASRRHSRGQRESPSSRRRDSASFSPNRQMGTPPQVLQESQKSSAQSDPPLGPVSEPHEGIRTTSYTPVAIKSNHDEPPFKCNKAEFTASHSQTNSKTETNSSVKSSPFLNIKLEKEERPLSLIPLKYATWHQQGINSTTLQLENELAFNSKIECTIPLRVLEPPTRDSPQSPDPEPQFVKQCSTEQGDLEAVIKEEEMVDLSGQKATGIQIETKSIGTKHSDILSKGLTGTNTMGLEIKNARPDIKVPSMHNIASLGGNMSKVEMTNFGNIFSNAPAPIGQGVYGVKQNVIGPGTNTSGSMMKGLWQFMGGPDSWKTGPNMSDARMRVQMENIEIPVIQNQNPDIISLRQAMQDPSIRGQNSNVHGPSSEGVKPEGGAALAVTNPQLKIQDVGGLGPVMALNSRGLAMMDVKGGLGDSVEIRGIGTDVRGRGWSRFGDYSPTRNLAPHMRHSSPSVKDESPDFKSHSDKRGFIEERRRPDPESCLRGQSQSRDGALSNVGPGVNNDRQGPQRAPGPELGRPGPSIRDESSGNNMCGARKDNQGLRSNPSELQLNVKQEMGEPYLGSDGGNPATQRSVVGLCPDMQNENRNQEVRRGPNTGGLGWEGGWGAHKPRDPTLICPGLDVRDEWKGSERRVSDSAFSGLNVHDEWRNLGPGPDRRGPDIEGTGPNMSGFGGQPFKGARSVIKETDCKGQLPEKTSELEGHGPDLSRSGGQDIRDPGSYRRGPGVCPGPDERGRGSPHFMEHGNDRGLDFRGPRNAGGGANMVGPGQDRRGIGRPHLRGSGPDRRAYDMDGPGPGDEKRGLGMESSGRGLGCPDVGGTSPHVRGPRGTDIREVGADRREPYVEGPGPDRRREGGPDFRGTRSARRGARMDSPGLDKKWQEGSQYRVPGPDRRETDIKGPGPAIRGSDSEPRREGKWSDMEGPGLDRRGRGGPHLRGPGLDRTGPDRESPGPDRRGPRSPDLRRSRPDRRRPDMEVPGPGWRGMDGRRGRDKEGVSVDSSGPEVRGSDLTGTAPDGRGIDLENPGPDVTRVECPRISGPEPGPERRGRPGPDLRSDGLEKSVPQIECEPVLRGLGNIGCGEQELEPDRRRPRRPDGRSLGHEMRGPDIECTEPEMEGYGPRMRVSLGPDFKGPGPDWRGAGGQDSGGPGLDRGGPGGPDSRGPGPDWRLIVDPDFLEPGSDRSGSDGPDFRRPGFDRTGSDGPDFLESGPDQRTPFSPDFRGTRPDVRGPVNPNFSGPRPDRRGPGAPDFRDPGPEIRGPGGADLIGPGPHRRGSGGPDFMGPGPDGRGPGGPDFRRPGTDRRGPSGPDFREPGPDRRGPDGPDFMVPDHDRRGSADPDFMGPGPDERGPGGPDFRRPAPDRRGPGGPDFREPGPDRRGPGGPDFRGPGPDGRGTHGPDFRGPGPDRRGLDGPDFGGPGPDGRGPDGPDCRGPGPDRRGPGGPDFRGPGPDRRWPGGPDFGGPGPDGRGPGGPDFRGPGPDRRGPGGPDFGGPGPDRRGPGGPDCRGPGPDRRGPGGQDLRGPSPDGRGPGGPDGRGPGPDRRGPDGPDFRGPWPDRRGPGGPDFRGPSPDGRGPGGPHFRGPGPDRRGPGGPDFRGPSPDRRGPGGSEFGGQGPDRRGPGGTELGGPGPDRRGPGGPDFRGPVPDRRGPGGPDFRGSCRERRDPDGPDFRGPGPDRRGPGGPNFRGSGPDRRGPGGSDFIEPGQERRGGGAGSGRELECTNFEDSSDNQDLSGSWPNQESCSGPRPYRRGSAIEGPMPDRRGQNMEGPYRGGGGRGYPNIRRQGPNIVDHWQQDLRESELEGSDREYHGSRWTGSGPGFRGGFRGPNVEDPWPNRRGPERNQGLVSEQGIEGQVTRPEIKGQPSQDNRGLDPRGLDSEFNKGAGMSGSPGLKLMDPGLKPQPKVPEVEILGSHGQSPVTKTLSPTEDIGGLLHLPFDSPHNQSANRLLKHKTPLLPTPTGLIRHPNRLIHKPNAFVHGRDWNRTPVGISRGTAGQIKKEDNKNEKLNDPLTCETDSDTNSKKTGEEPVEKKATE